MAPTWRTLGASPPPYGKSLPDGYIFFLASPPPGIIYLDEEVNWFDYCDTNTWSSLWLDFIEQLRYDDNSKNAKVYWLLPRKTFSDGNQTLLPQNRRAGVHPLMMTATKEDRKTIRKSKGESMKRNAQPRY
uniref:Uncharacterized protein n=1 Tax=Oryza barthii TaxID=65489 RepID=A0A0D3FSY7_9ORYZ